MKQPMIQDLQIPFDRVTYRDGQLLTAGDMQSDQARNARLWELHTRYLHATWGIAIGFTVSGNNGDSLVQVGSGYAVDQQGKPLVSSRTVPVPLPLIAGPEYQVLVIGYQDDASYRDLNSLDTLCFGGTPTLRQEAPTFSWKAPPDVRQGQDVPLVTVQVAKGTIQNLDTRVRRYVEKLTRPYVATGATDQGYTQWKVAQGVTPPGFLLYRSSIDTSDAGFNSTPFYFPELHMWNQAPASIYGGSNSSPDTDFVDYAGSYTFLTNPTQTGFDFNVLMPTSGPNQQPLADPTVQKWTVSWVGVEVAECYPPLHLIVGLILNFTIFPIFLEIASPQ